MFGLGPIECALVALYAIRRIGLRRTLLAALGVAAISWVAVPRPCGCFRLPLQRCISTPRYSAIVKADARNLMSLQEIHFADEGRYATDLDALDLSAAAGVEVYMASSGDAWSAWVTHDVLDTGAGCMVDVPGPGSGPRGGGPAGSGMDCVF